MNHRIIKINFLLTVVIALAFSAFNSASAQTWTKKSSTPINSNSGGYYEYLPEGYSGGSGKYPLIIFIHGINEKGDGSSSQLGQISNYGLPKLIKYGNFPKSFTVNGMVYKFIVIAPQFKSWPSTSDINAVYNYAVAKYRVNTAKVYLTGLSMGGALCWNFGANTSYNKKIAAMVPIAAAASASLTKAKAIADAGIKCWGTHNAYDTWVSPSNTKNWVADVKTYKPTNAKISLFNSSSHDAWSRTYNPTFKEDNKNVYEWMLQYSVGGGTTTTTNAAPVASAGADKTITLPTNSVTLSGSGKDADGSISKYAWTKVSGPSTYTFSSTTVAAPTVKSLVAGTYVFRLTVTDSKGATDYDDVKVIVNAAVTTTTTTYAVPGKVQAENYKAMDGVQKETTTDAGGGQNVGYIDLNNWMDYSIKTSASGTFSVTFRVASGASSGSQFQVKNSSGTVLATVTVPNTGGYQVWKDVKASVKLVSGTQTIRLVSTNSARWNINYMTFATSTTSTTTTTTTAKKVEAENYVGMGGVEKHTTTDVGGGEYVGAIDQYDWIYYNLSLATSGTYTFTFRLASPYTGAAFEVYDTYNGVKTKVATVSVPNTGGSQVWKNVTASISLKSGAHAITIYSIKTVRFNFNYFTYALPTTSSATLNTTTATKVAAEGTATVSAITVAPNPISDKFVLTVSTQNTGAMKVQLIDQSGVVRKEFQVTKAAAGTTQTYLSASTLTKGTYFVKVQVGDWTKTTEVVKL